MRIVTMRRLISALEDVRNNLRSLELLSCSMAAIEVYLIPAGIAYGYKVLGRAGHIGIPAVSLHRIGELLLGGTPCTLRDVLRHEYAHVLVDVHPAHIRSKRFTRVFEGTYQRTKGRWAWDPEYHVSPYAATNPSEDFSETFMYYVKCRGKLPRMFDHAPIRRKWNFIERLRGRLTP